MRPALTLFYLLLPGAASAHFGHLGTLAGHDHWTAAGAIGAAAGVAAWGWWQGKKAKKAAEADAPEAEAEADPEAEPETAG